MPGKATDRCIWFAVLVSGSYAPADRRAYQAIWFCDAANHQALMSLHCSASNIEETTTANQKKKAA
jgi:hypothetical protein